MKTVGFLLLGNHPKAGTLKERTISIIKIIKESGGRIEGSDLEEKIGVSRKESPSMFYKPLAAMKRWDLVRVHKIRITSPKGKIRFKTEYELTPQAFYDRIQTVLADAVRNEIDGL